MLIIIDTFFIIASVINNIIAINKPKGWTSNDVVQKIKHHFKYRKVGHAGTLDPNATGVLVIGINDGTKLLNNLTNDEKEYIATIQFGIETDSYDITGEIIATKLVSNVNQNVIFNALNEFQNKPYFQYPPLFSAKKVHGKKLYVLARNKQTIEIEPTLVKLINFKITSFNGTILSFKLVVSKGFYVRSLAHDLGLKLNNYATLKDLCRTRSGQYQINDCIELKELLRDNHTDDKNS